MHSWFDYLLLPEQLAKDIEGGLPKSEISTLLHDVLTNLLNSQNLGFFMENPFELWFCDSAERKVPVLRNLSLQLLASLDWSLGEMEATLPPPLLLYILQAYIQSQPSSLTLELQKVAGHLEIDLKEISQPGPVLHSLVLFHRWIVRTYIKCRTPHRLERTSVVMVPGVKRDPALIFRDQTTTVVMNLVPTSLRFLHQVLEADIAPANLPSHSSFSGQLYSVPSWENTKACEADLFKSLVAYDLGCCYFFNEDYVTSTACFNQYFKYSNSLTGKLAADIQEAKLNGYLQCLGLTLPEQKTINTRFLEAAREQLDSLISTLEEDTLSHQISDVEIDNVEVQLRKNLPPSRRDLLDRLGAHTLVRRVLRGLPLNPQAIQHLETMGETGLKTLESLLEKVGLQGSSTDTRLIRSLTQKLILFGIIPRDSRLVANSPGMFCLEELVEKVPEINTNIDVCETFNLKKVCKYNAAVQLLCTFKIPMLTGLAKTLRPAVQVSQRWHLEEHYQRVLNKSTNISNFDDVNIILSKVNQLKRLECWDEASELLTQLAADISSQGGGGGGLLRVLEGDQLAVQLHKNIQIEERGEEDFCEAGLQRRAGAALLNGDTNVNLLQELCLSVALREGDWESVTKNCSRGPAIVPSLAKALTNLFISIPSSNPQVMKKLGREVWDLVFPFVSSANNKRGKEQSSSPIKDRTQVQRFLSRISNPELNLLVLSLLSTLFNVVRDDPSTELVSLYPSVWPTGLATNQTIQDKLVQDLLQTVLAAYLRRFPMDPNILQTSADLHFANSNYRSALTQYIEMLAVKTDFFELPIEQGVLNDGYVSRMVKCCAEMGRLTQAVVLSQCSQEPNYAQVFKYLEDRDTCDAADTLYSCIWDMTILEFAMSLHTRRGEVARRRHALSCIMQLELNTNNEQEIKREAANIRKSIFFRSLASQFFTAAA